MKDELDVCHAQLIERDTLIQENGLVIVDVKEVKTKDDRFLNDFRLSEAFATYICSTQTTYRVFRISLNLWFLSVPSLLIAIGAIIFFIAFFGCCGAVRESYCMIVTFTSLLVVVFILEFSGGISGYVLRARASSIIQNKMEDSMKMYKNNTEVLNVWDNLQRDFDCCGTRNASDWVNFGHMSETDIPVSCCIDGTGVEPKNCSLTSAMVHQGCYNKFLSFVKSHAMQLGGVGLGIAFVQAMGICFSVFLARSIRNSYESV